MTHVRAHSSCACTNPFIILIYGLIWIIANCEISSSRLSVSGIPRKGCIPLRLQTFHSTYLATTSKCHQESIACFVALCIPNWSSSLVRPLFVAGVHTAGKPSRPTSCVDQESCILGRTMHLTAVDIRWGNRSWLPWQLLVATAECKLLTWQWVISFVVANLSEVSYPIIHVSLYLH